MVFVTPADIKLREDLFSSQLLQLGSYVWQGTVVLNHLLIELPIVHDHLVLIQVLFSYEKDGSSVRWVPFCKCIPWLPLLPKTGIANLVLLLIVGRPYNQSLWELQAASQCLTPLLFPEGSCRCSFIEDHGMLPVLFRENRWSVTFLTIAGIMHLWLRHGQFSNPNGFILCLIAVW